jgi:hypothetical protein
VGANSYVGVQQRSFKLRRDGFSPKADKIPYVNRGVVYGPGAAQDISALVSGIYVLTAFPKVYDATGFEV